MGVINHLPSRSASNGRADQQTGEERSRCVSSLKANSAGSWREGSRGSPEGVDHEEVAVMQKERSATGDCGAAHMDANDALEILYATPDPKEEILDVGKRDLPSELRERYWIEQGEEAGVDKRTWTGFGIVIGWKFERHELGRRRNEPGDGFRYVFRAGTAEAGGRAEWFEVTEVFEGVKARDVEAFMRCRNGIATRQGFDSDTFLDGLDLGTPSRAAQRRAADKVIAAVGKKLGKGSYRDMEKMHGYGTLIVGLPLWFASYPANPLRAENVIDDFVSRVGMGLKPHFRRLGNRRCPFWRIVVVWKTSAQSMREWTSRARFDLYDDPALRDLGPIKIGSLASLLVDTLPGGLKLFVYGARPEKLEKHVRLPQRMGPVLQKLEDVETRHRPRIHQRIRWRILQRCVELACFVRVHGLAGLERWIVARLSPRHWIVRMAVKRRAERLYRASCLPAEARRRARVERRSSRSR